MRRLSLVLFLLSCALAAAAPALPRPGPAPQKHVFPGWPRSFQGQALRELSLTPLEERFASGFPGRIARFTDGRREIVLRWVDAPTRLLHPAADCFRGAGHEVGEPRLHRDAEGRLWSEFRAGPYRVRERIEGPAGSWTDPGAWSWSAGEGPWWAWTVTERAPLGR